MPTKNIYPFRPNVLKKGTDCAEQKRLSIVFVRGSRKLQENAVTKVTDIRLCCETTAGGEYRKNKKNIAEDGLSCSLALNGNSVICFCDFITSQMHSGLRSLALEPQKRFLSVSFPIKRGHNRCCILFLLAEDGFEPSTLRV